MTIHLMRRHVDTIRLLPQGNYCSTEAHSKSSIRAERKVAAAAVDMVEDGTVSVESSQYYGDHKKLEIHDEKVLQKQMHLLCEERKVWVGW